MHEFGSPKLDDPTSGLERAINTSFDRLKEIVEDVIPQVANRPLGSQDVPMEQRLLEYRSTPRGEARKQANDQRLAGYVAQEGDLRGLQLFIEDIEELERG